MVTKLLPVTDKPEIAAFGVVKTGPSTSSWPRPEYANRPARVPASEWEREAQLSESSIPPRWLRMPSSCLDRRAGKGGARRYRGAFVARRSSQEYCHATE